MFSLQTIFGKGNQFFGLLEDAAVAAADSTSALHAMLRGSHKTPALDAFRDARERERGISDKINEELVNSFVTALEREDIEALSSALVRIPKQVERFAERYALATEFSARRSSPPRPTRDSPTASTTHRRPWASSPCPWSLPTRRGPSIRCPGGSPGCAPGRRP